MAGARMLLDLDEPISDRELILNFFYSVGMELGLNQVEQSLKFTQIMAEQFDVARVGTIKSVVTDIAFDAAMNECSLKAIFKSTVKNEASGDHEFLVAPEDNKTRTRSKDREQSALGIVLGEKGLSVLRIAAEDFEVDIGKSDP
eukprot:3618603-Pleurochrysis_carterae.AAC.1